MDAGTTLDKEQDIVAIVILVLPAGNMQFLFIVVIVHEQKINTFCEVTH